MKIPYNRLQIVGPILFAARGGKIHSFNAENGSYISTWQHPDVDKILDAPREALEQKSRVVATADSSHTEPPPKKQKIAQPVEDDGDVEVPATDEADIGDQEGGLQRKSANGGKGRSLVHRQAISAVPDRPMVSLMVATTDGQHLVAVSGHDKTIWVFKNDGSGQLIELSKRTMSKRPCTVAISPDDSTILSADKFGDVYSLPLLPSELSTNGNRGTPAPSTSLPAKPFKPAASRLTVHSARNREALANQERQASKGSVVSRTESLTLEHSLLLGHVSMLTCLLLASHEERWYIITADRDEHIRVSRFIPQAHIIENFCLGHTEFINALTIPPSHPDVLISGGGDDELFLWDWQLGRLASKMNLLTHVQTISESNTKVAVSKLYSCSVRPHNDPNSEAACIIALCEDVPTLLCFTLAEPHALVHTQSVLLPGNPVDLAIYPSGGVATRMVVAIDSPDAEDSTRLLVLGWDNNVWMVQPTFAFLDSHVTDKEPDMSPEEVRKLLYTTETLRKQPETANDAEPDQEPGAETA